VFEDVSAITTNRHHVYDFRPYDHLGVETMFARFQ